jgi:hypothetical protein
MMRIRGLPQPLTGGELVTILQEQNGEKAECSMPLSMLASIISSTSWAASLPTTRPTAPGALWNNGGVVSIS